MAPFIYFFPVLLQIPLLFFFFFFNIDFIFYVTLLDKILSLKRNDQPISC